MSLTYIQRNELERLAFNRDRYLKLAELHERSGLPARSAQALDKSQSFEAELIRQVDTHGLDYFERRKFIHGQSGL